MLRLRALLLSSLLASAPGLRKQEGGRLQEEWQSGSWIGGLWSRLRGRRQAFSGSGASSFKRTLPLPAWTKGLATFQNASTQHWTDGSLAPGVFKNVLLVVHCRWQARDHDEVICRDREKLFKAYAPYFGDVFWMTRANHCVGSPIDPHVCLAWIMEGRGAKRDGILYTHFDALINPHNLAIGFDKKAMGSFGVDDAYKLDDQANMLGGHSWANWHAYTKKRWRKAVEILGHKLDPHTVYIGDDDIFYFPRESFAMYSKLAHAFADAGLYHEVAGPTIRAMIHRHLKIGLVNLGCSGSCCTILTAEDANNETFRCGHSFDLRDESNQRAFKRVLRQGQHRVGPPQHASEH